jgi:hypothetical protein
VRTFPRTAPAAPQSYGVIGKIFFELKYGPNRKLEYYSASHHSWDVMVNGLFGTPAEAINTPERYYFTIPTMTQHGYSEEIQKAVGLSGHPFLGQFPAWLASYPTNGTRMAVLLSKDRSLPFVKLTRGEFAEYPKATPDALLFDAVSFDLQQQPGPNDQMFISNIKITSSGQ